jgi:hypothetical protein
MKHGLGATVIAVVISTGATVPDAPSNVFMSTPPKETVYATDSHMGFSFRVTLLRWLGGVPVADERDARAANEQRWWGEGVPTVPPEVYKPSDK